MCLFWDLGNGDLNENIFSKRYRIRLIATPGFYFSKWVFGWGLIQKILQKVDFLTKKWGFIQENPQKLDFSHYLGSIQEWGSINADTVVQMVAGKSLIPD